MTESNRKYLVELREWAKNVSDIYRHDMNHETKKFWKEWEDEIEDCLVTNGKRDDLIRLRNKGIDLIRFINTKEENYGNHELPSLPYAYDALEPYIDEEIMRLHHSEHHQSYVDGLNKAEKHIYLEKNNNDFLRHWLREQAFHGSGHYLHSIFWTNMTPPTKKSPAKSMKKVQQKIDDDFGSFERFKELFTNTALSVQGPGWAILLYDPVYDRFLIESIEKHQLEHLSGMIPILVLDIWEHAYYLQYKTSLENYVQAWWHVVNWEDVNKRLIKAQSTH